MEQDSLQGSLSNVYLMVTGGKVTRSKLLLRTLSLTLLE